MRIPIHYQFMLPLLVVAISSLVAIGIVNSQRATQQTKSRIEQQLRGVLAVLAESSYPLTDAVLRQMGGLANAEFVLTDREGKPLASGISWTPRLFPGETITATAVEDVALGSEIVIDSRPYYHSAVLIGRRANKAETGILHILFARDDFEAAWRAAFLPPLLVGAVTILAVALVVHVVAGRVSRTLSALGDDVQRLADGDFSAVRPPKWNDETRDLASAVNQTARRLADYEAELRQTERLRTVATIGAGLAHEMRNAATGCRLAVDLHAEDCQLDAADESLEVARRQLAVMEDRLQQLLQMGQQNPTGGAEEVDFAKLVSRSIALVQPAANHARVDVAWSEPLEQVLVSADSDLVGQAIVNLLLNALDAAKTELGGDLAGQVCIELRSREEQAELTIADSGYGLSEDLSENVFEPFVTTKPEGVGLGLAVAKRVVESFGGQIGWAREEGFTKFSIRLPLAAAGASCG